MPIWGLIFSFLVEEDAQKTHVSIEFVHSRGLFCEIVFPHRHQQIPLTPRTLSISL
jgi:hypothetical protein